MPKATSLTALVCCGLLGSCASYTSTTRVFDGRVVVGPVVAEQAYALYLEGALEEARERWPQALKAYDEATRYAPESAPLHVRLGRVACKLGVGRRADAEFARAEDLDPSYAPLFYEQAECAERRGRHRAAVEYAERALGLASDDLTATLRLAALHERTQESHAARTLLVSFAATHPDSNAAWSALWTFTQRHHDATWATLARERSKPPAPASLTGATPCPAPVPDEVAGRDEIVAALTTGDETRARRTALACRLSTVNLAELALAAGHAAFALSEALRALRADPDSNEAFALALLAAHRAEDDTAFEGLLLRERQLTAPTPRSRDWTLQLLRERGH